MLAGWNEAKHLGTDFAKALGMLVENSLDSRIFVCPRCRSVELQKYGFSPEVGCLAGKRRQRFRCPRCKITFSENFFKLSYQLKHVDQALNAKIFKFVVIGISNREIGRLLDISEHSVRIRIRRLAKRALCFQSLATQNFKIDEALCLDGLENFAASQYDPNNINQIIGRDSLFIYDFNFSSLNRKGRMSTWQKNRLKQIEADFGRYNPKSIRVAVGSLLRRMAPKCTCARMPLISDEHFQYRHALKKDLRDIRVEHMTISSKACRNFQNILFSVNHADLLIRQRIAAFARETISFSKTAGTMCQRYALFMVHKNFMLPQFTKKHINRPLAHEQSPAQSLGITKNLLGFGDIFFERSMQQPPDHLNHEWVDFFNGSIPKAHWRNKTFNRAPKTQFSQI